MAGNVDCPKYHEHLDVAWSLQHRNSVAHDQSPSFGETVCLKQSVQYMRNMQQHWSVELRQYALVDQMDGHRALHSCNLASDNQTHNNKSIKILQLQPGSGSHIRNLHTVFGSREVYNNLQSGSLGADRQ